MSEIVQQLKLLRQLISETVLFGCVRTNVFGDCPLIGIVGVIDVRYFLTIGIVRTNDFGVFLLIGIA